MRIKAVHTIMVKNIPVLPGDEATVSTPFGQDLVAREHATVVVSKKKEISSVDGEKETKKPQP